MTTYHVVVTMKNPDDKSKIVAALKLAKAKTEEDFKVEVHEHADDPSEEAGEYVLWYHSSSHGKVRYYAGPPTKATGGKPDWTYDKKKAAKLSKNACELIASFATKFGYTTPCQITKGPPSLKVVKSAQNNVVEGPFAGTAVDIGSGLMGIGITAPQMKETLAKVVKKHEDKFASDEKSPEGFAAIEKDVADELTSLSFAPGDGLTDDEANAMPTGKKGDDE